MNSVSLYAMPNNEPIFGYGPGSREKIELKKKINELKNQVIDIPIIIGGKEIRTGNVENCVMPHDHQHVLARFHQAGEAEVKLAIETALEAKKLWESYSWVDRVSIFRKAGDLLATKWRYTLNAATMLGLSKNPFQAEIDSACELIDFFKLNAYFATQIYTQQPVSPDGVWNRMEFRPLEGFVFAVTPFNFTSIAGNLPAAPALMGNVVLWKPASSAVYPAYFVMKLLEEAGVPAGVINFVPGPGPLVGNIALNHPEFTGVHFTGSTRTFNGMWKTIADNMKSYKTYPRIVGETGGKDFIMVHKSANRKAVTTAIVRGAFEFQGQKCSAASRAYIPVSVWNDIKDDLITTTNSLTMGNPEDFRNFVNAVIDKPAFDKIKSYIDYAKESPDAEIIAGGDCDDSKGYYIRPTIILAKKPDFKTMEEEIFGPVITIYVYEDDKYEEMLEICDKTSPYGLTGAVFAQCRNAIKKADEVLQNAAGNFYINDKPTGAVVNQQPFGGARASGTNDKAGSSFNLIRWISVRSVKENFVPPEDYKYPFMMEE